VSIFIFASHGVSVTFRTCQPNNAKVGSQRPLLHPTMGKDPVCCPYQGPGATMERWPPLFPPLPAREAQTRQSLQCRAMAHTVQSDSGQNTQWGQPCCHMLVSFSPACYHWRVGTEAGAPGILSYLP
jgi:hypothetical protein